jgi:hypothetical protein
LKYKFLCTDYDGCGAVNERIQSIHDKLPDSIDCQFCGKVADLIVEAPAVLTGNMTNQSFDVAIGRDSAARWDVIRSRQEKRDTVRRNANQVGLAAASYDEFKPITDSQRKVRSRGMKAVERDGYKQTDRIPERKPA